jgi:uncharacterized protein involved in exopolysaccharide biosynthesis
MPSSDALPGGLAGLGRPRLRRLLLASLAAGLLAGGAVALCPDEYRSEASLMTLRKQSDATSLSQGLGQALMGRLPIALDLPSEREDEQIFAFLTSRVLKERLIDKHALLPRLYPWRWDGERKAWRSIPLLPAPTPALAIQDEAVDKVYLAARKRNRLIALTWLARDPADAAAMLGRVIEELRSFLDREYVSDARREREFIEGQLDQAARELEAWERKFPTEAVTMGRISRELAARQAVFAELQRQLALARIEEARQQITFKVLDPPFVPVRRSWPRPLLVGGLAGAAWLLARLAWLLLARPGDRPDPSAAGRADA